MRQFGSWERVDELMKRVSVLEEGGEEKGSSSSEDEYGRDWRWESECEVQKENVEGSKTAVTTGRGKNNDERWSTRLKEREMGAGQLKI